MRTICQRVAWMGLVLASAISAQEAKTSATAPSPGLVELKVYFYPGVGAVKCGINFSAMPGASQVDKAVLVVKGPDDAGVIWLGMEAGGAS